MGRKSRWIQKAVKRKGALRAYVARKYGPAGFTSKGTIKVSVLKDIAQHARSTRRKREARLALLLRKFRRR